VPKARVDRAQLARIKDALVRQVGVPQAELARQIGARGEQYAPPSSSRKPPRTFWEDAPAA